MKFKELIVPSITDETGQTIAYGGNQEWFPDLWARQAGCGSVTGANMAACFSLNRPEYSSLAPDCQPVMAKADYLSLMQEMYRRMKPGLMGYPYPAKLARAFSAYSKEKGLSLAPHVVCSWKDWKEGYALVKQSLDSGSPVGFLILAHRAPELKEDIWHWITICGYGEAETDTEAPQLIVSDCGDRDLYPAEMLLDVHKGNITRMVCFSSS